MSSWRSGMSELDSVRKVLMCVDGIVSGDKQSA